MRTEDIGNVFVIHDIKSNEQFDHLSKEYSSKDNLMSKQELNVFLGLWGVYHE